MLSRAMFIATLLFGVLTLSACTPGDDQGAEQVATEYTKAHMARDAIKVCSYMVKRGQYGWNWVPACDDPLQIQQDWDKSRQEGMAPYMEIRDIKTEIVERYYPTPTPTPA